MLIMKYKIIVGFFATILAVSAIPSGNHNVQRVKYPRRWIDAAHKCLVNVPDETRRSYTCYNKATATRDAKRLALCYYTESGEFVNGRFDPDAIESSLREYVGSHDSLQRLINIYRAAANAGNAENGDESDKAYAYHAIIGIPENLNVFRAIFRPFRDSQ